MIGSDADRTAAAMTPLMAFAERLRGAGLRVGTGDVTAFCEAVARLGPVDATDVYWAGRACLVTRAGDLPTYDAAFDEWLGAPGDALRPTVAEETTAVSWQPAGAVATSGDRDLDDGETLAGSGASDVDVLRHTRFDHLDGHERAAVQQLIAALHVAPPTRRTRRTVPRPRGARTDLRRSLRHALRTDGELIRRAHRTRRVRPRRLVLLLDVSRSMTEFSRALLLLAHAARRGPAPVEVYCFGTRLTRVTDTVAHHDPQQALAAVSERVGDLDGGTRIAAALQSFLDVGGRAGLARGAVVVVCSDGLERGDPTALADAVARLHRLAHRLVWVNPLTGDPRYEPRAAGMAAALPHVDDFRPGHDLASLEALAELLATLSDRQGGTASSRVAGRRRSPSRGGGYARPMPGGP